MLLATMFFTSEKNCKEPKFALITIFVRTCLGELGRMQVLTRGFLLYLKVG